ncbi:sigma-70 family RNA polymerase sigma factor [bacterium]|nr:MAG: sigma-70 family RNA polymerase sigma factor [bacterium]
MSQLVLTESIQGYLNEVSKYPLLSHEEELSVATRYFKTRNIDDAHTLVTSNLRYVVKIALDFRNYGCKLADLIQEGNIGLMHAVKKFNPHKGFRLITYASWWIKASMQDFILKSKGLVRRGAKALKKKLFYKSDPKTPAGDDISAYNDLSLNTPAGDGSATHMELLTDIRPSQEDVVAELQESIETKRTITTALKRLSSNERYVIERRVMTDEPESLQGLGDKLGITRERVRQIETNALKKLKTSLALTR